MSINIILRFIRAKKQQKSELKNKVTLTKQAIYGIIRVIILAKEKLMLKKNLLLGLLSFASCTGVLADELSSLISGDSGLVLMSDSELDNVTGQSNVLEFDEDNPEELIFALTKNSPDKKISKTENIVSGVNDLLLGNNSLLGDFIKYDYSEKLRVSNTEMSVKNGNIKISDYKEYDFINYENISFGDTPQTIGSIFMSDIKIQTNMTFVAR